MSFSEGIPLFPKHDVVLAYLEKYASNVRHLTHFSTQAVDISLQISSHGNDTWQVKTVNQLSRLEMVENLDTVVVASGHAAVPYIPDVPGIADWNFAYPGSIIHSKSYRSCDTFKNRVSGAIRARQPPLLPILYDVESDYRGNFSSGIDIANQIGPVAAKPLLQSQRHASLIPSWN
jgi:hypothetical protein